MKQFMQTNCNEWSQDKQLELELATATASIMPENNEETIVCFVKAGVGLMLIVFRLVIEKWFY